MMDSKQARQEAVNVLKQNLILDAALRIVVRDGYFDAKLEDIAQEAGFSKASLYHYFPDKEAIFLSLIIREQQSAYDGCVEIIERDLPFLDTLREIICVTCTKITNNTKITGLGDDSSLHLMMSSLANMLTKHKDLFKNAQEGKYQFSKMFTELVERAKQKGEFAVQLDSRIVSTLISAIINTVIMDTYQSIQNEDCDVDLNKTIDGIMLLFTPWVNKKPELISAEGEVNHA